MPQNEEAVIAMQSNNTNAHCKGVISKGKYTQDLQLDQRSPLFIQMFVVPLGSAVSAVCRLPSAVASRHQPNRFSDRSIVYI